MYDFLDGDFFESLADLSFGDTHASRFGYPIQCPTYEIIDGMLNGTSRRPLSVFIDTERLYLLLGVLQGFPHENFIVIAHNSDYGYTETISNPTSLNIWSQNFNGLETSLLHSLPIGLERSRWLPDQKKQEIIYAEMQKPEEREMGMYVNFNPATNPQRRQIFENLKDKPFVHHRMIDLSGHGSAEAYQTYVNDLKRFKYVLSPPGNGLDCHRTWEALYLKCIPILLNNQFFRNVYSDMPVLLVDDFGQITQELLEQSYQNIFNRSRDKLFQEYWRKAICQK